MTPSASHPWPPSAWYPYSTAPPSVIPVVSTTPATRQQIDAARAGCYAYLDQNGCLVDTSIYQLAWVRMEQVRHSAGHYCVKYTDQYGCIWVEDPNDPKVVRLAFQPTQQTPPLSMTYTIAPPAEPLSVRQQQETYVAYKTLKIYAEKGRLRLYAYNGAKYEVDDTAVCSSQRFTRNPDHLSPVEGCACGFYALIEKPDNWEYGRFRAQVELFGRVVHGERGYRAERQRVLSLEARRQCSRCDGRANGFSVGADGYVYAICSKCSVLSLAKPAEMTAKLGTQVSWAS